MVRSVASLKRDPRFGLDSRWSWITAGFLGWVLFVATSSVRVAGVLFYGIVDTYGVTRQEASWPVTLNGCLLNLGGPVMGALCGRFSCRAVILTCAFLTGIAVSVCFFAEGVLFINVFFGIIHGLTLSGIFVTSNVLVAQHFEKRRITACSMIFTFCGLNTFFLPPLVEWFRTAFGIRGAFLLLGAITLNTFPGAIVLRSPSWITAAPTPASAPKAASSKRAPGEGRTSLRPLSAARISRSAVIDDWTGSVNSFGALDFGATSQGIEERPEKTLRETVRQFLTVSFLVDAVSFTIVVFGMGTFILLSVDLAKDRRILPSDAVYLLHAFSAGDIAFRALSGFVIDSGLLSLEAMMVLGYLIQAFAFEFLVWAGTFPMMLIGSVLIGVSNGSRISLQAPSLIKDFGVESLPIMMGGMVFCIGAGSLVRPALIGHYRDNHGSYNGLLHIVAVINVVMVGVWTVKVIINRRRVARNKADIMSEEHKRALSVSGKGEANCDA